MERKHLPPREHIKRACLGRFFNQEWKFHPYAPMESLSIIWDNKENVVCEDKRAASFYMNILIVGSKKRNTDSQANNNLELF